MSITMIGTVALDSIESPHGTFERILGGSATYAATAARIFSPNDINVISIIGKDFPDEHHAHFATHNINTSGIVVGKADTFHWQGKYEGDMAQAITIATDLNVLLEFDPQVPDTHKDSNFVFCANFDPELQEKAILQFKTPQLVVLDTMNFWIDTKLDAVKKTLKLVDVLIINDQELRLLTGESNIISALPMVTAMGPSRVIVKKGEHGAIMYTEDQHFVTPAFPLSKVIDPTGAGDSFAGAFLGYLSKKGAKTEADFREAVIAGTLVSSFTVQGFSLNQLKTITETALKERYTLFQQYTHAPQLF